MGRVSGLRNRMASSIAGMVAAVTEKKGETKNTKKGKTGSAGTGISYDTAWNNMSDEKKAEFENKADFVTQAKAYNQEKYGTADEVKYDNGQQPAHKAVDFHPLTRCQKG